jgi:glyoxylase-like metal-dependent hydrolase (beta-lactamase superfamily II)
MSGNEEPPVYDLPVIEPTDRFRALTPLAEARGLVPGGPLGRVPAGAELGALIEATPDLKRDIVASGVPTGVTTCDLVTLPYPVEFGMWRAARSPAPFLWITNRMLVVQWDDPDGTPRTLLWEASDHERGEYTPYFARLKARNPLPDAVLAPVHGTVLGHLRALGIDPEDVDYLAFDHLHTQDTRRLVGTTRPAPDLGSPDAPLAAWFPNAVLISQRQEWEAIRYLHPLQAPWYQPETYVDLPEDRLALIDGDVLLGPGVALVATPGHTAGNMSLVLNTDGGVWTSSENGVAAESWAPRASRIPGLRQWSVEWGQEVIMNANTIEFAAWQYDSMMVERLLADPSADAPFPQCFPSSELTPHRLAPGVKPSHQHLEIEHGRIRSSTPLVAAGAP